MRPPSNNPTRHGLGTLGALGGAQRIVLTVTAAFIVVFIVEVVRLGVRDLRTRPNGPPDCRGRLEHLAADEGGS